MVIGVAAGIRLLVVTCTQLPRVLRAGLRVHRVQQRRMELAKRDRRKGEAPHMHACWLVAPLLREISLQEVLGSCRKRGSRRLVAAPIARSLIERHEGVLLWSMALLDFIIARFKLAYVAGRLVFDWTQRNERSRCCVRFEVLLSPNKR